MKLQNSELVLNADGSIYHLKLLPEQLADIVILVGDQGRVPRISRYFDSVEHKVKKREFVTHTGRLGKTRLSVLSTGIGPDNIDIVMNELDALCNINLETREINPRPRVLKIIRLGTAGGLQEGPQPGEIAISSAGLGLDGLLNFYAADHLSQHAAIDDLLKHCQGQWDFPLRPYFVTAGNTLLEQFASLGHVGITATNPGFYGPQGRQLRAPVRMRSYLDMLHGWQWQGQHIINLEMETAAIYGLANLLGHQAVSISALLANRPRGTFATNPRKAVQHMIIKALERIEEI
ncbi:MAG: nucleoside phosphorylase [Lewinellaceae bacterium]|nr:nucleoside phosphorylase [Lewinellaceae bacterium]